MSATKRDEAWFPMQALTHVLFLAAAVVGLAAAIVFLRLDGLRYYLTPVGVRGYDKVHRLLRPSGSAGHLLGVVGTLLMLAILLYSARKRWRWLSKAGSLRVWLEAHIFCGVVGPSLVTLHTSFKFNGVISVAYWSMVLVVLSGFIGRYLYVRIPKTIRGTELGLAELEERASDLKEKLFTTSLPVSLLVEIGDFEKRMLPAAGTAPSLIGFLAGDLQLRLGLHALGKRIRAERMKPELLDEALGLIRERAVLLRRMAYLGKTRRLFDLWHVFHRPLVYLMFLIAALHVGVALYFGYALGS